MGWYKKAQSYNTPDEVMEWLTRHNIPMEGGKYVFYHGSLKVNKLTEIKAGSLLAETGNEAMFFSIRDRGLSPKDVVVYKILVDPSDINIGHFASLNRAYKL